MQKRCTRAGIRALLRLITRRKVETCTYSHAAVPNPCWLNEVRGRQLDNYIADNPAKKAR